MEVSAWKLRNWVSGGLFVGVAGRIKYPVKSGECTELRCLEIFKSTVYGN